MHPEPYPIPPEDFAFVLRRWLTGDTLTEGESAVVDYCMARNRAAILASVHLAIVPDSLSRLKPASFGKTEGFDADLDRALATISRQRDDKAWTEAMRACDGAPGDGRRANAAILAQVQEHAGSLGVAERQPSSLEALVSAHVRAFQGEIADLAEDGSAARASVLRLETLVEKLRALLNRALRLSDSRHLGAIERQEKIAIAEELRGLDAVSA